MGQQKEWKIEEDEDYKDRHTKLLGKDLSLKTIYEISSIHKKYQKYLSDLTKPAINWLILLNDHPDIITDLFDKFNDDKKFNNKLTLFSTDSPIDKQRQESLTRVRNKIVKFIKQNTKNNGIQMTDLQKHLTAEMSKIRDDDVEGMKVVTASWDQMKKNVSDPAA